MKRFIVAIACIVALTAAIRGARLRKGKLASLIQAGDRKAALDMIRAGADVNEAQPDGTRPIHWAVYRVDYEVMEALIAKKAKADVRNELGSTPLAEAVKLGDARMVKMLLDAGSGPEGANDDGQTALMLAIKNGDLALVQMLVNAGANVNVVEKVQDQTPLMWAASANQNAEEMVKLLLSKGANVKARAKSTDWPAQMTSEPRAQYHSYGGLTPLDYAARNGCYYCVEALVGAGADVNVPNILEGITPLMTALDSSHNDVAKFLLDHGANPKVWDVYGRTALYIAVDHKAAGGGVAVVAARQAVVGRRSRRRRCAGWSRCAGAGAAPGAGGRGAGAPATPAARCSCSSGCRSGCCGRSRWRTSRCWSRWCGRWWRSGRRRRSGSGWQRCSPGSRSFQHGDHQCLARSRRRSECGAQCTSSGSRFRRTFQRSDAQYGNHAVVSRNDEQSAGHGSDPRFIGSKALPRTSSTWASLRFFSLPELRLAV